MINEINEKLNMNCIMLNEISGLNYSISRFHIGFASHSILLHFRKFWCTRHAYIAHIYIFIIHDILGQLKQ